jgi:hypothetical protein
LNVDEMVWCKFGRETVLDARLRAEYYRARLIFLEEVTRKGIEAVFDERKRQQDVSQPSRPGPRRTAAQLALTQVRRDLPGKSPRYVIGTTHHIYAATVAQALCHHVALLDSSSQHIEPGRSNVTRRRLAYQTLLRLRLRSAGGLRIIGCRLHIVTLLFDK